MKRTIAVLSSAALVGVVVAAQEQAVTPELKRALEVAVQAAGSARVAIETRVTRGKPYSSEAVTEFVQVLGDGNRIVRKSSARLSRDSDGRTRREDGEGDGAVVTITDPVAGTSFILRAATHTATKSAATFARVDGSFATYTVTARGAAPTAGEKAEAGEATIAVSGARGRGGANVGVVTAGGGPRGGMVALKRDDQSTKEDLGEQQIEGVAARGTRTTTVIPAGSIGNEQPITVISEQWFSPDLDVLVLTRHSDPRVGETIYRLTNISRSEPDRSLFQVPSDYTVEELRKPPVMWKQQQQQ